MVAVLKISAAVGFIAVTDDVFQLSMWSVVCR
jgi:hypothetical protein